MSRERTDIDVICRPTFEEIQEYSHFQATGFVIGSLVSKFTAFGINLEKANKMAHLLLDLSKDEPDFVVNAEWVKVEDDLPENNDEVLVTDGAGGYTVGYHTGFGWVPSDAMTEVGNIIFQDVVSWMKIPK